MSQFFHEEAQMRGMHMVKVYNDKHEPVLFGLDHNGYEGKAVLCPNCDTLEANNAFSYLKTHFSLITWHIC